MRYNPSGDKARQEMLSAIGVESTEQLFSAIPSEVQLGRELEIKGPTSEFKLLQELKKKAATYPTEAASFLGAGSYRRFIPAAIEPLVMRGEFLTSYTPYQPEISQGTLQAMFEFQTMLAELTGMDVANGSMYEGATATAEAVMMAQRINGKKKKVILSQGLHPEYLECVITYVKFLDLECVVVPLLENGQTDLAALQAELDETALCSILQVVNFYGVIEDQKAHQELVEAAKCINIAVVTEMTSLGMIAPPGQFSADIVVGEAQSLGLPTAFGGPYLGVFACKQKYVRKMPGRLSGLTKDSEGKRAFCLTLSTREQHIRREKATSNICSNQALCALWVTIYLSLLGKSGLKELALLNYSKANGAKEILSKVQGLTFRHSATHYNEFVVELSKPASEVIQTLLPQGFLAGVALSQFDKSDTNAMLISITEVNSLEEVKALAKALQEAL